MKKLISYLLLFLLLLNSCQIKPQKDLSPLPDFLPKIDRIPVVAQWEKFFIAPQTLPKYDNASTDYWQVDLRSVDISNLDLTGRTDDLLWANFDSKTIWPSATKIPKDFDWQQIMELGKNPGLGIRELHNEGITGRGVGIAIIDQPLLVDHVEYKDQLRLYEEADNIVWGNQDASMHGTAVASIAVGKTVGVAPEADLYFIGTNFCYKPVEDAVDFSCLAKDVDRILEINDQLPQDRKIRVISMAIGWMPDSIGYDEITEAVNRAREKGIFVVCSSLEEIYGYGFNGLGRIPTNDPDQFESYDMGNFWFKRNPDEDLYSNRLMIPMDSRTTASPTGKEDYVFYREGGWSWSIPYIAGMYALAAQVNPEITPEEFLQTTMDTGRTIDLDYKGEEIKFGPILDPTALIAALKLKLFREN